MLPQTDVAVFLMERGADVTNVEDVNENGPLDLCSGRAATRKYDGLPHQVQPKRGLGVMGLGTAHVLDWKRNSSPWCFQRVSRCRITFYLSYCLVTCLRITNFVLQLLSVAGAT